jgi:phospholipase C
MDIATLRRSVDTIVIVMMENRSFDHLLGYLSHEDFGKRNDVNGLHRPGPDFDWANPAPDGSLWAPQAHPDGFLTTDLPHDRTQVATQLNDGAMTGFVEAYFTSQTIDRALPPAPMRFCTPSDLPVTSAFADAYCVCDNWFAALPVDTQPNRLMAISGQTLIDSTSDVHPVTGWLPDQPTILDWLKKKKVPFATYVDGPFLPGVGLPSNFVLMRSQWPHLDDHAFSLDDLRAHWNAPGKAAGVIYCEPYYNDLASTLGSHGNCNHPPLPVSFGETFLKKVYDALTSRPDRWAKTVMIICYDEHGGFFDHVPPPPMQCAMPARGKWHNQQPFTTLGVRVPGLVVSPLVSPRSVYSGLLDHTSILQLVVERFGTPSDLGFFGAAEARKNDAQQPIQSLVAALSAVQSALPVAPLPAPAAVPPAMRPLLSRNSRLFVTAMLAKAAAGSKRRREPKAAKTTTKRRTSTRRRTRATGGSRRK